MLFVVDSFSQLRLDVAVAVATIQKLRLNLAFVVDSTSKLRLDLAVAVATIQKLHLNFAFRC